MQTEEQDCILLDAVAVDTSSNGHALPAEPADTQDRGLPTQASRAFRVPVENVRARRWDRAGPGFAGTVPAYA